MRLDLLRANGVVNTGEHGSRGTSPGKGGTGGNSFSGLARRRVLLSPRTEAVGGGGGGGGAEKAGLGFESGCGTFILIPRSSDESLSYLLADWCAIAVVPRLRDLGSKRACFASPSPGTAGLPRPHLHSMSFGAGADATLMRRQRKAVVAVERVKSTQRAMLMPQMDLICRHDGLLGSTHS